MIFWSHLGNRYINSTNTGGNIKAMLVGIQRMESIQLCSLYKRGKMCKMFFLAPEQQIPTIVSTTGVF
jgi:hypothetical protein